MEPLVIFGVAGFCCLLTLSIIDLRTWLLPDWLNLIFALLGIGFHAATQFVYLEPLHMMLGGLVGAGVLYLIRMGGNWYYKQDTLGLGDVKLLGAAGLWLGPADVVMAMTIGAFCGLLHGLGVGVAKAIREKKRPDFQRLMIPVGPGFCAGIILTFVWKYIGF